MARWQEFPSLAFTGLNWFGEQDQMTLNTPFPKYNNSVGILDYGAGNPGSVLNLLEHLEIHPKLLDTDFDLNGFSHLIFPGVGHAGQASSEFSRRYSEDFFQMLKSPNRTVPLLGICVGMQLLGDWCEEGNTKGWGLFPYQIQKMPIKPPHTIPHMGWNHLVWNPANPLCTHFQSAVGHQPAVYFVHSYAGMVPADLALPDWVLATTEYAGFQFIAAVASRSTVGFQFHVEKSAEVGIKLMKRFLELTPC